MDQEEDRLHPLEHTDSWELLANTLKRFAESFQKVCLEYEPFHGAVDAFEDLRRLALSPRGYRKAVRWDEKNRRRRLKGLPEKPNPYPRIWKT